jgi:hypothetical protein
MRRTSTTMRAPRLSRRGRVYFEGEPANAEDPVLAMLQVAVYAGVPAASTGFQIAGL